MIKNHIKSQAAPKTWPIERKKTIYVMRPDQSGTKMEFSMPIGIIFKTLLKYCKTIKEVKKVLQDNTILVDGRRVNDPHESLGFMGVLTITETKENYRLIINKRGKLELKKTEKKEAGTKPCVIINKKVLGKNKVQINLFDGKNILIKKNDYKTGDTLLISLPEHEIKEQVKLEKGAIIMLTGGKHIGLTGEVEIIEDNKIRFKGDDKKTHETEKRHAFPIGTKKALIAV